MHLNNICNGHKLSNLSSLTVLWIFVNGSWGKFDVRETMPMPINVQIHDIVTSKGT